MTERPPKVSVVIPVKNDTPRLTRCLDALAAGDFRGELEVLIIDNGSTISPVVDGARRSMTVRLLTQHIGGSYSARNTGIDAASGTIIAFTDSDCIPEPTWISMAVRHLGNPSIDAVAGKIVVFPQDAGSPNLIETYEMFHAFPQQEYVEEHGFGVTANLVVRAEAVRAVGGFDARLLSGGDREFCERLRSAGSSLVYRDDVVVRHPARQSFRQYYRKRLRVVSGVLAIGAERGENLGMSFRETARRLVPPVGAARRAYSGKLALDHRGRARYVMAAWAVRYLDVMAWRVAIWSASRKQRTARK